MRKTALIKSSLESDRDNLRKQTIGGNIFQIINIVFFVLFGLICIIPFYYIFINTISNDDFLFSNRITIIPNGIQFSHYLKVFGLKEFRGALQISATRTVIGTALMVLASSFIGYLVTKKEMWGSKYWYRFFIITLYANAGLMSWYFNMNMLGLTDNFWGYILPSIVAPVNIILVKNYVRSIPSDIEDSAAIDGAGYITRFYRIIIPMCKPILMTVALFSALYHWNSFVDSFVLMRMKQNLLPLQFFLYKQSQGNNAALMSQMMLSDNIETVNLTNYIGRGEMSYILTMVITIPIAAAFLLMNKYFVNGIKFGRIKE